jgi:hypothetical protein
MMGVADTGMVSFIEVKCCGVEMDASRNKDICRSVEAAPVDID